MKTWSWLAVTTAIILGPVNAATAAEMPQTACKRLSALKLESTQITKAEIAGPDFTSPSSAMSNSVPVKRTFCRVAGLISPSTKFEVWLPLKAEWNGRFQGVGNGGMAGGIAYFSLRSAVEAGYAAVSSDLGHEGGGVDGSFAIGAPEKVRDWGYRATHEMTRVGKALTTAFYGTKPRYSYFIGCSGGGRQSLIEAQRFPDDYDGILAGDPTIDFSHLTTGGRLWEELSMFRTANGAGYIPAEKIPTIAAAVVAACDALDGVRDGILEDPRQCQFQPASLKCMQGDRSDCLTPPQVEALEKIYAGATTTAGKQVYPGYERGGESGPAGWSSYVSGSAALQGGQWAYASGFVKGMVFENLQYDPMTFNYDVDVPAMDQKSILGEPFADVINGTNPDLRAFQKRGSKLIAYHGWSDPGVAPRSTVDYYNRVVSALSDRSRSSPNAERAALAETQKFFRLFMVPGMQHCTGGPGANAFGGVGQLPAPADPDHDIRLALERWVEHGAAPRRIVATKYVNDMPEQGVERTHPLCPYPQMAHFTGSGRADDAAQFVCK